MPAIATYTISKSTSNNERRKLNKTIAKKLSHYKGENKALYKNKLRINACSNCNKKSIISKERKLIFSILGFHFGFYLAKG